MEREVKEFSGCAGKFLMKFNSNIEDVKHARLKGTDIPTGRGLILVFVALFMVDIWISKYECGKCSTYKKLCNTTWLSFMLMGT